jgi:hypothetical protein
MDQSLNKKHHVKDTTIKWDCEESIDVLSIFQIFTVDT